MRGVSWLVAQQCAHGFWALVIVYSPRSCFPKPRFRVASATPFMGYEHGLPKALIEYHQTVVCQQLLMGSWVYHVP